MCPELLSLVTSGKLFVKGGYFFLPFALSSFWKFQEESYIVVWEAGERDHREEQETKEKLKGRRKERGKEWRLIQEKG